MEFELFGDGGGGGGGGRGEGGAHSSSAPLPPPPSEEGEEGEETTEGVAVKAWVLEERDAATASFAPAAAVSLSLVVRGGGSAVAAEQAPPPPPSFLLPLDSAPRPPSSSPSPSSSSPSPSSSCCWRRHEASFPLRELGGRVSSVALRLTFRGGGGGENEAGGAGGRAGEGGGGGGRPLFAATLGAVALVPSSFRPPKSPVASWIALRGRSLEWGGCEGLESDGGGGGGGGGGGDGDASSSSKVKRWEVWRRGRKGEEPSFLAATRARRWWASAGDDDSLRRGDEVFVRAVFADGGREAVASEEAFLAGQVEVVAVVD